MKKQFLRSVLTLGAAAMLCASPAQAENISPKSPLSLLELIKAGGAKAELTIPSDQNPYIESYHDGLKYVILFMNCDDDRRNCTTIQFYMGYSDAKGTTLEQFNEWNKSKRFARAYRDDEGDAVLEMDLDMDPNGLPRENVLEALKTWKILMIAYQAFLFGK